MQTSQIIILIAAGLTMFSVIGLLSLIAHYYTLNGIKSKTVGDDAAIFTGYHARMNTGGILCHSYNGAVTSNKKIKCLAYYL